MFVVFPNCNGHFQHSAFVLVVDGINNFKSDNNTNSNTVISCSDNGLCSNGQTRYLTCANTFSASVYDNGILSSDILADMDMILNVGMSIFW